jgi:hypothetical protein
VTRSQVIPSGVPVSGDRRFNKTRKYDNGSLLFLCKCGIFAHPLDLLLDVLIYSDRRLVDVLSEVGCVVHERTVHLQRLMWVSFSSQPFGARAPSLDWIAFNFEREMLFQPFYEMAKRQMFCGEVELFDGVC